MRTIDDIMKDRVPGSVIVKRKDWERRTLRPYFKVDSWWHGINNEGYHDCIYGSGDVWELVPEHDPMQGHIVFGEETSEG